MIADASVHMWVEEMIDNAIKAERKKTDAKIAKALALEWG